MFRSRGKVKAGWFWVKADWAAARRGARPRCMVMAGMALALVIAAVLGAGNGSNLVWQGSGFGEEGADAAASARRTTLAACFCQAGLR